MVEWEISPLLKYGGEALFSPADSSVKLIVDGLSDIGINLVRFFWLTMGM